MIQAVHQGDHRYIVYDSGEDIGCIAVSRNPYHDQHFYLNLGLTRYDPRIAPELFRQLRQKLQHPLQVMEYANPTLHDFLIAGGFERRRRCYELEARVEDLASPLQSTVPLTKVSAGSAAYDRCREMLYAYYSKTHLAVSPLTADAETFCADLPETAFCSVEEGEIVHVAFVQLEEEGYEIAYVGTKKPSDFRPFAQSLVAELFRRSERIIAECDDVDPAAMALKSLFQPSCALEYDTYVLD